MNLLEELCHHYHNPCHHSHHHHLNHSHNWADQNRNLFNQLHHPKFLLLLSEMNVIIATPHNYWNQFQSAQNSNCARKALDIKISFSTICQSFVDLLIPDVLDLYGREKNYVENKMWRKWISMKCAKCSFCNKGPLIKIVFSSSIIS